MANARFITAAFISAGMHRDVKKLDMARDGAGSGCYELVASAVEYAEYASFLYLAGSYFAPAVPGVFDYEVSEEFGVWYVNQTLMDNRIPDVELACKVLRDLAEAFWVRDETEALIVGGRAGLQQGFSNISIPRQPEL